MTTIEKIHSSSPVLEETQPNEAGFTEALLFAYQQILKSIDGQKKDQLELLKTTEDSIAIQQMKNEELNKLDFFMAGDVKAALEQGWEELSPGMKEAYIVQAWCGDTSYIGYRAWDRLSPAEKAAARQEFAAAAHSAYEADNKGRIQDEVTKPQHTDQILIKNEGVTKQRDYLSNQIVIQQQRQQVVQSQSQTTASGTSQCMSLAESLVGSLKTIAEKVCYVVG